MHNLYISYRIFNYTHGSGDSQYLVKAAVNGSGEFGTNLGYLPFTRRDSQYDKYFTEKISLSSLSQHTDGQEPAPNIFSVQFKIEKQDGTVNNDKIEIQDFSITFTRKGVK